MSFLALYRPQFTGQFIMNPSKRRSRRSIEKSDDEQKSEHSEDQSHCYSSYIVFPKQKRMKLMKGNILQSDDVMVFNMRYESSRLILKSLRIFAANKIFSDNDETEEESEEDDNDIDYDQVPITRKFKVIT